jgi:hypothetical protein
MEKLEVAKTIVKQIGNGALFMLGAKDLVGGPNFLQFRIGRNAKGVNLVRVDLEPSDTYKVVFMKVRKMICTVVSKEEEVYFEDLRVVLSRNTGMATSI